MIAKRRGVNCLLIFGLLAGLCGCEQKLPSWCPFGNHVTDNHGITTPSERKKSLQELVKKAPETTDPGQRESICQELAQQLRKPEPDANMRGEILRTMAVYGGQTADAALRAAAKDWDPDVRVIVCGLWGKRGDAAAVQVLEGVFSSDSDRDVRMAAARGLGHAHDPAAARALAPGLDDPDPAMKHRVMAALEESTGKSLGTDAGDPAVIDRWRQYVKTGQEPPVSLAQRIFWWYH
jgi:hypothetical protein